MNNQQRVRAIVLRRTDYAEADRVLQLLTTKGRVAAIAKGVRREKSKLAGGIELFAICDMVIRSGRGDLGLVTSARLVAFYRHILEDYERMQFAYLAMKLVDQASATADEPEWYAVLSATLEHLDQLEVSRQLVEAWFYIQYAGLLGDELNARLDVAGNPLDPDRMYMYDQSEKAFRLSDQGNIGANHIKLLRLLSEYPLSHIVQVGGIGDVLDDCWLVTRQHAAL